MKHLKLFESYEYNTEKARKKMQDEMHDQSNSFSQALLHLNIAKEAMKDQKKFDIENHDSDGKTLDKIINEIETAFGSVEKFYNPNTSKDKPKDKPNDVVKIDNKLKSGDLIKAKTNLRGVTNSYNTPERINISKGTILRVPSEGTRMGDVFCTLVEGECTYEQRPISDGEKTNSMKIGSKVGLSQGHKSYGPYDLGKIDSTAWEKVNK